MDQNQDKMPETRLKEALSALMDGEVDELELRRLLRELPASPELEATWRRYHAVQASLRQEVHGNPAVDLLAGVRARLAAEQEHITPSSVRSERKIGAIFRSRVVRYLGQGAIAASVAAAALMGLSVLEVADTGSESAMIADAGPTIPGGPLNTDVQTRTVSADPEAFNRLQQAVIREFSASSEQIPVRDTPEFPVTLTPAE